MNIYIYSDESGVFDKKHNESFIFAGLICIGSDDKDIWSRKYSHVEGVIRNKKHASKDFELKATNISNKEKGKLFRSLNRCYKFAVVIKEKEVLDEIFRSKKDKQRYLDFAYKIGVKRALEELIKKGIIKPSEVERLHFFVDEHSTATNGRDELNESLEQEFKLGTYNWRYDRFFPPIFKDLKDVQVEFCNSKNKLLVRAADIVANRVFHLVREKQYQKLQNIQNLKVTFLPE